MSERKFSSKSLSRLSTCHPDLQLLCNAVLQDMDITVLCGQRNETDQNKAFADGKSKLKFPNSAHNKTPSLAVDCAPYPVDFNDIKKFEAMCIMFELAADKLGIDIKLGRDFSFHDYPHIELSSPKRGKKA